MQLLSKKNPFPRKPKPVRKPTRKPLEVSEWVSENQNSFLKYLFGFRALGNLMVSVNTNSDTLKVLWNTFFLMPKTESYSRKPQWFSRKLILPEKLSWYSNEYARIPFWFPNKDFGNLFGFRPYFITKSTLENRNQFPSSL